MLIQNVALVAETKQIKPAQLNKVAAALQKQASRDFTPIWGVKANVSAFARLEDMPTDYWPVIVQDDIKAPGAGGYHEDENGQPFALVQYSEQWSLTASHETLEMLGDPFGNRLVAGKSAKSGQGRVNFLVEVCDPSEDEAFAYTVNGVTVSDFYTPHFFDPVAAPSVRYSYVGAIQKPRTVLKGGYLSWVVPKSNEWFQMIWFGTEKPAFRSLGVQNAKPGESLRAMIDRLTPTPQVRNVFSGKAKLTGAFVSAGDEVGDASEGRAARLHDQIRQLKAAPEVRLNDTRVKNS